MDTNRYAAFGVFNSPTYAETCIDTLVRSGFDRDEISILAQQPDSDTPTAEQGSKASEGAATGATTGGVIGGTLGLLAGIGVMAVPGAGPFLAAGPIMATLAGLGAGAATGGIAGALVGAGMPEDQARLYAGYVTGGGILLTVHCETQDAATKAKIVLESSGAKNISSSLEDADEVPPAVRSRATR